MLEQACSYQDVRAKVMLRIGPRRLTAAMAVIDELTRPPDDRYYPELQTKYRSLRRYLPHVLTSIQFSGTQGAKPVLDALEFLKSLELDNKRSMNRGPLEFITNPWRRYVFSENRTIDRQAYTFCFLDRLRDALSRREVFISASSRYADPRVGMLDGDEGIASILSVPMSVKDTIIGVLRIYTSEPRNFSDIENKFISGLAEIGSIGIEYARIYDHIIIDHEKLIYDVHQWFDFGASHHV